MHKEPLRILAVNPGTRYLGVAIFRGPEILDWGVKVVGGKTPAEKRKAARLILLELIDQYYPDALAVKRLHPSRSSPCLNELVGQMKILSRRRGLKIYQYSIQEVKDSLAVGNKTNRRKLATLLAAMYPALIYDLQQESQNRNPYRMRMFEAVALAIVCYQQLEKY
jgi:Holliday junction resolvasome RuvABC endonuclease subunit